MVDSIGGPVRVNNLLSTLNIPEIQSKNLNSGGPGSSRRCFLSIRYFCTQAFTLVHNDSMGGMPDK